jgi:DNA replication protein DnaC
VKKTLEEFDFEFQSSIDKKVIEDLATLRFIHNAENVVLLGPPGVGKSHIAVALGVEGLVIYINTLHILCLILYKFTYFIINISYQLN